MISQHLSRWAEQWIIYSTTEFGFIKIADQFYGSSMMPNATPTCSRLIRGKTGGVYGQARRPPHHDESPAPRLQPHDMQEDKRFIFFAYDQVEASLTIAAAIVLNTKINVDNIAQRLDEGFADATVFAEYLVKKASFRHRPPRRRLPSRRMRPQRARSALPTRPEHHAQKNDKGCWALTGPTSISAKVIAAYQSDGMTASNN